MKNTSWSRRELIKAGAGVALGGLALEALSLTGRFDNRALPGVPHDSDYAELLRKLDAHEGPSALHIGQSTHLISIGGLRVLTDPWFFDPAFGSLRHPGPLPVAPQALGDLDLILITHDHPDHADLRALDRMDKNALVIVGVQPLIQSLKRLGFTRVEYIDTWKSLAHGPLTITATPALHDVPEAGFVLNDADHALYFAGDTATHDGLPQIAERFTLDVAIVPIDGTRLRWEPRLVMDPHDAAQATALLKPKIVMSSHADAYQSDPIAKHLLSESAPSPHAHFRRLIASRAPSVRCVTPTPGTWLPLS